MTCAPGRVYRGHNVDGALANFGDDRIAIGVRMAERLGLRVGDTLSLISPSGNATAFGTIPRQRSYEIAAIFDIGMYEYDNNFIFMPLDAAQIFFRMGDAVSTVELFVDDVRNVDEVADTVTKALGGARGGGKLAGQQQKLFHRAAGGTQRDVSDPHADHPDCRFQHHQQPDHAGEG